MPAYTQTIFSAFSFRRSIRKDFGVSTFDAPIATVALLKTKGKKVAKVRLTDLSGN